MGVGGRSEREKCFTHEGSLSLPLGKTIIFYKQETEKIELVARPGHLQIRDLHHDGLLQPDIPLVHPAGQTGLLPQTGMMASNDILLFVM